MKIVWYPQMLGTCKKVKKNDNIQFIQNTEWLKINISVASLHQRVPVLDIFLGFGIFTKITM